MSKAPPPAPSAAISAQFELSELTKITDFPRNYCLKPKRGSLTVAEKSIIIGTFGRQQ